MSGKKEKNILSALWRYFSGEQSDEGQQIYDSWFDSFDDSKGYVNQLDKPEADEYKRKIFWSVKREMGENKGSANMLAYKGHPRKRSGFLRIAAIIVIGSLLSLAGLHMSGMLEDEEVPIAVIERSNSVGQISEFRLPDGSRVWLSPASTLEYPETFSDTERWVRLNGQAFFEVERDPARPFRVESGPLSTKVLGTSFNVSAYLDDPGMHVTVVEGKVEVAVPGNTQKQTLVTSQRVRFDTEKGLGSLEIVDASLAKAWTRQELVFIRETFATIAKTFERWYGVEFVFENDTLKDERFVYHFKELSLGNSMIILKELADFDYDIEGRQVVVKTASQ